MNTSVQERTLAAAANPGDMRAQRALAIAHNGLRVALGLLTREA